MAADDVLEPLFGAGFTTLFEMHTAFGLPQRVMDSFSVPDRSTVAHESVTAGSDAFLSLNLTDPEDGTPTLKCTFSAQTHQL